jgi:hypothetical protein
MVRQVRLPRDDTWKYCDRSVSTPNDITHLIGEAASSAQAWRKAESPEVEAGAIQCRGISSTHSGTSGQLHSKWANGHN